MQLYSLTNKITYIQNFPHHLETFTFVAWGVFCSLASNRVYSFCCSGISSSHFCAVFWVIVSTILEHSSLLRSTLFTYFFEFIIALKVATKEPWQTSGLQAVLGKLDLRIPWHTWARLKLPWWNRSSRVAFRQWYIYIWVF